MSSGSDREAASVESSRANARVDLPEAFQREIRELARALPTRNYYDVLGVSRDAESADIRDAFFERSKTYHPDRYFKKELGPYSELLNEIYKRIVAAHDVLRDPKLRGAYDRSLTPTTAEARPLPPPPTSVSARPVAGRARLVAAQPARPAVAGADARLAAAPARAEPRARDEAVRGGDAAEGRGRLGARGAAGRARARLRPAREEVPRRARRAPAARQRGARFRRCGARPRCCSPAIAPGAAELLEEAAQLCPTDAELAFKLADLLFAIGGELEKAALYAERAVSLDEENVRFRKRAGEIYRKAGDAAKARKHLQRAWELDPMDKEIRQALQTL